MRTDIEIKFTGAFDVDLTADREIWISSTAEIIKGGRSKQPLTVAIMLATMLMYMEEPFELVDHETSEPFIQFNGTTLLLPNSYVLEVFTSISAAQKVIFRSLVAGFAATLEPELQSRFSAFLGN